MDHYRAPLSASHEGGYQKPPLPHDIASTPLESRSSPAIPTRPRQVDATMPAATGYGFKSAFDRICAILALVLLAPLLLIVAGVIHAHDRGPVCFAHPRIGRGGRTFLCLKFRTMIVDADKVLERHLALNPAAEAEWRATQKLKRDPRVTSLGDFLRKSSLDELPQLINIARGEMSFVGPRPIVDDEVRHYGSAIQDYLAVRPGLTGQWQISGRNDTGYDERVQLDQEYVRNISFTRDLTIILHTFRVVAQRRGSY